MEGFRLHWPDENFALTGCGERALVITRTQAEPSGQMESMIIADVHGDNQNDGDVAMGRRPTRKEEELGQCGPVGPPYSVAVRIIDQEFLPAVL